MLRRAKSSALALMFFTAAWVPSGLAAPAEEADSPDSVRATMARWVETQEIISREKRDWQQAREILGSRIEVVNKQIAQLEEQLGSARSGETESGEARAEILAEIEAVKATTNALGAHAEELEGKVRKLYAMIPASLRENVQPLYERMPAEGAASVSVAERFQNILGILNEVSRINSEISVVSEIRPLSDGRPSEVKTIYVGLGQAYFVSARGEAGIGRPSEDGWSWLPANEIAHEIKLALEILQNKSSPRFVPLPVEIR